MKILTISILSLLISAPIALADETTNQTAIIDERDLEALDTAREPQQKHETLGKKSKDIREDDRQEEEAIQDDPFIDNNGNGKTSNAKVLDP